jgi:murein DD-endopeptidase MepM/ murein hydrolase activator NlpD
MNGSASMRPSQQDLPIVKTACYPTIFLILATLIPLSVEPLVSQANNVPPGSVVRWPGENIERCSLGERSWAPREGACWYPVDLLATGQISLERARKGGIETRSIKIADYPYAVQHIELKDDTHVNLSAENVARSQRESGQVGALWPSEGRARFELPLSPPLEQLPTGGRFGARRIINGEPRNPHTGSDYAADEGTTVLSVADGEVVLADEHFFAGNSVFVDHGDGLISMYFHLSRIDVAKGDIVTRGQVVGAVGATGRATGPHLHFGLRWHGKRVDPSQLLDDPSLIQGIQ